MYPPPYGVPPPYGPVYPATIPPTSSSSTPHTSTSESTTKNPAATVEKQRTNTSSSVDIKVRTDAPTVAKVASETPLSSPDSSGSVPPPPYSLQNQTSQVKVGDGAVAGSPVTEDKLNEGEAAYRRAMNAGQLQSLRSPVRVSNMKQLVSSRKALRRRSIGGRRRSGNRFGSATDSDRDEDGGEDISEVFGPLLKSSPTPSSKTRKTSLLLVKLNNGGTSDDDDTISDLSDSDVAGDEEVELLVRGLIDPSGDAHKRSRDEDDYDDDDEEEGGFKKEKLISSEKVNRKLGTKPGLVAMEAPSPSVSDDDEGTDRESRERKFNRQLNARAQSGETAPMKGKRRRDSATRQQPNSIKKTKQASPSKDGEEKKFACKFCSFTSHSPAGFAGHMRVHPEAQVGYSEGASKKYACEYCSFQTDFPAGYAGHMRKHNSPTKPKPEVKQKRATKFPLLQCPHCPFSSHHPGGFATHSLKHKRERELGISPSKQSVSSEEVDDEEEDISLVCHLCSKLCKTPKLLKFHIRSCSGLKPFECKVCGRTFGQKCHLARHMGAHA